MKGISGFCLLSSFPPLIPVRKQLIVFPQSFSNLPAMRGKICVLVCFLAYCLRLWRQSVNSIPSNLHVCAHICLCACSYSLCLSPFKCVRPPMVLSISFHGSVGSSACEAALHHWGDGDKNYYIRLKLLLTVVYRPGEALGRGMTWMHGIIKIPAKT